MARIDLAATIDGTEFPAETWRWLDLIGDAIKASDEQARLADARFVANTAYKKVLLAAVHSQLSGLKATYTLLRTELVHQAAGQARLLCEGAITLRYIAGDRETRAVAFLDYASIEAYEAATALIEWESEGADHTSVAAMIELRAQLEVEYQALRPRYQFVDKNGKTRNFQNWANRTIADMSRDSPTTKRLYELIYRQLSSYVHGSAWSFRHIPAYSAKHYDAQVVYRDVAQVSLGTLAVWEAFADFCENELGWSMAAAVGQIAAQAREFSKVVRIQSPNPGA
jgi:hypothetical protein